MTHKFFDSDERVHVHTVAYTAPGPFTQRDYLIGVQQVTHINENAASYSFTNKNNPNVNDRRFRIF
jgi:hypothetical protein